MTLQERIMNKAGDKYVCLENEHSDNTDVITIANRNSDALLLNYEIGDSTISVNVINKDEGSIVDNYDTDYTDTTFDSKIDTSISTYEAISKSHAKKMRESTEKELDDELKKKFDDLLFKGDKQMLKSLSDEDLKKLLNYISTLDDSPLVKAIATNWVQIVIDDRDAERRKRPLKEEEDIPEENFGDYPPILPSANTLDKPDPEEAFADYCPCELIQAAIDKIEKIIEESDDDNAKTILDDVIAELNEILDEISSYSE